MGEKTLRDILEFECDSNPKVLLQAREIGRKTFQKIEGTVDDDRILRWMDCFALVHRMDHRENLLQVAVEGQPHDYGKD